MVELFNNIDMANITLKGNALTTVGELPPVDRAAPPFELVKPDLSKATLADYKGKKVILNIFPSVDTGTCATSVREFNMKAVSLDNTVVLCISKDLPFAQARFCGAEGIENVEMLSDFVDGKFGQDYGLTFADGPLAGLSSRCIVVVDEAGKVVHTEQVSEIVDEPDYAQALAHLQ